MQAASFQCACSVQAVHHPELEGRSVQERQFQQCRSNTACCRRGRRCSPAVQRHTCRLGEEDGCVSASSLPNRCVCVCVCWAQQEHAPCNSLPRELEPTVRAHAVLRCAMLCRRLLPPSHACTGSLGWCWSRGRCLWPPSRRLRWCQRRGCGCAFKPGGLEAICIVLDVPDTVPCS